MHWPRCKKGTILLVLLWLAIVGTLAIGLNATGCYNVPTKPEKLGLEPIPGLDSTYLIEFSDGSYLFKVQGIEKSSTHSVDGASVHTDLQAGEEAYILNRVEIHIPADSLVYLRMDQHAPSGSRKNDLEPIPGLGNVYLVYLEQCPEKLLFKAKKDEGVGLRGTGTNILNDLYPGETPFLDNHNQFHVPVGSLVRIK